MRNLLGLETCGKRKINYLLYVWNVTLTYPLGGGPCGGAYDGVYPVWKGGGGWSWFMGGDAKPPLGKSKIIRVIILSGDGKKR